MSDFSINNLNLKNNLNVVDVDGNLIDTMTVSDLLKAKLLSPFAGFADALEDLPVGQTGERALVTEGIAVNFAAEWIIPNRISSTSNAGLMIQADEGVPMTAPTTSTYAGDRGWYYKNSAGNVDPQGNPSTKINWYFGGAGYGKTLGSVTTLAMNLNHFQLPGSGNVFLTIYTKFQGDGNDGGSWYRSRLNYLINPTSTGKHLVHFGADIPELLSTLPRLDITNELDTGSSNGPQASDEEIFLIALSTNSSATVDTVEISLSSTFELYSNDAASNINIYRV
jgi:hypothetical protein